MQTAELGHFAVIIDGTKYNLKATLRNMANLADSRRLVRYFDMLHNPKLPVNVLLDVSREVILACSDSPQIEKHLIKCRRMKPHITKDSFSINDQINVAAGLMRHGIAGVNRPDNGLKSGGGDVSEFNAYEMVAAAKNHFGMSLSEAWDITMSEFAYHIASHFPTKQTKGEVPSMDDHKLAMQMLREKAEREKQARAE
ncbi:hypothetical protein [Vibrio phage LP.1]|nr:hypothetical protein [Vibrio phage LP.1]